MSTIGGIIFTSFFTVSGVLASILFSLWYLFTFQHPEDKLRAWIPKIVMCTSTFMALFTVFLLPIDIAFADLDLFPFLFVWIAVAAIDVILLLFVLPFAIVYYEALDTKPNIIKQLLKAVLTAAGLFLVFTVVIVITWFVFGEALIPVQTYGSDLVASTSFSASDLGALTVSSLSSSSKTLNLNLMIHLHVIAFASVIGMVLFIIFASVGAVAIPMDLISEWRYRPRPFSNDRVAQFRIVFRNRAMMLKEIAQKYTDDMKERQEDAIDGKKRRLTRAERKLPNRIREASRQLEKEYDYIQISTGAKRYLPLLYWGKLVVAVLLFCLSALWLVHLVLFVLPEEPLHPGLNLIFRVFENFLPFLGTALYSVFAVYLLACTVKGVTRLGTRILLFANIHPLEKHNTYSNALMFNAMVMLLISLALVRFLCTSFSVYARATSANIIFNSICDNLAFIRHAFPWAYFTMPFIAVAALLLLVIFPRKNELVDRLLQNDLTKAIKTATEGKKGDRFIDSIKNVKKLKLGKARERGADDNV